MKMTLERYIQILNTKYNLKQAALELGFVPKNDVLYVKEGDDEVNIKFDDEEIDVWYTKRSRRRSSQYYNLIRTEIDKGLYTEKSYIEYTLKYLKESV